MDAWEDKGSRDASWCGLRGLRLLRPLLPAGVDELLILDGNSAWVGAPTWPGLEVDTTQAFHRISGEEPFSGETLEAFLSKPGAPRGVVLLPDLLQRGGWREARALIRLVARAMNEQDVLMLVSNDWLPPALLDRVMRAEALARRRRAGGSPRPLAHLVLAALCRLEGLRPDTYVCLDRMSDLRPVRLVPVYYRDVLDYVVRNSTRKRASSRLFLRLAALFGLFARVQPEHLLVARKCWS